MRCFIAFSSAALALIITCRPATADTFTPTDRNVEALGEAGAFTASELEQVYGMSPANLSYTGTFGSTSWSMLLSGTYAGQAVSLVFIASGTTSAGGSYTESGLVGTDTWAGGGSWSYSPIDTDTIGMLWHSADEVTPIAGVHHKPDREIIDPKEWHDNPDGSREDNGSYNKTEDGAFVSGPHREHSEDDEIPGRSGHRSLRINLNDDQLKLNLDNDFNSGTSSGEIDVAPLPSTVSAGAALLFFAGVGSYAGRKRMPVAMSRT